MLRIDHLVKTYAGDKAKKNKPAEGPATVFAVHDVSFEVKEGELFTLLGPSGCGKTTTLRSIAGLEKPDSGRIAVGDRVMFSAGGNGGRTVNMPANQRGLGMVFQSYAIWPHMTVFDNVAFPLQVRKRSERPSKKEIRERVERWRVDRKSTRLNSSHANISYAVFCLKKKKTSNAKYNHLIEINK